MERQNIIVTVPGIEWKYCAAASAASLVWKETSAQLSPLREFTPHPHHLTHPLLSFISPLPPHCPLFLPHLSPTSCCVVPFGPKTSSKWKMCKCVCTSKGALLTKTYSWVEALSVVRMPPRCLCGRQMYQQNCQYEWVRLCRCFMNIIFNRAVRVCGQILILDG